jgi:hypothetical protein
MTLVENGWSTLHDDVDGYNALGFQKEEGDDGDDDDLDGLNFLQGEAPIDCAARETYEECGYDVHGRLREEDSFSLVSNAKRIKM